MQKLLIVLLVSLVVSGCTYTINHTIVYFEQKSVGESATVDLSMDSQFSTSKVVSPATELSIPLLKEMNKSMRELRTMRERELNRGIKPPDQQDSDKVPYIPAK